MVDLETTGRKPSELRIIEFAGYIVDNGEITQSFETLVHPKTDINFFITRLTGIDDEMVKDAPVFEDITQKILDFTKDAIFVAHNVTFDYGVLRREFRRLGIDFRKDHLCTVQTSKHLMKELESHNLGKISKHLGIDIPNRHRATDDALATVKLLNHLHSIGDVNAFIRKEINPDLLHGDLNLIQVDQIPAKPGVIKYFDENKNLLFLEGVTSGHQSVYKRLRPENKNPEYLNYSLIAKISFLQTGTEVAAKILEREQLLTANPPFPDLEKKLIYPYSIYTSELQNGFLQLIVEKKYIRENVLFHAKNKKDIVQQFQSAMDFEFCLPSLTASNFECMRCKDSLDCLLQKTPVNEYNKNMSDWMDQVSLPKGELFVLMKGADKNHHFIFYLKDQKIKKWGNVPKYFIRKNQFEKVFEMLKGFSQGTGSEELLRRYLSEKEYKGLIPV